MSKIHFERFDKLLKFLPKSKIKAGDGQENGKYPFFKSGNDQSKFIDTAIFEGESLIIGDGGSANINFYDKKFSASDHCYVIQKDSQNIDVKYVYYYLKSNLQILEAGFKGAGLKNISKKYISNIKIPIVSLGEQRKIAKYLSQIENLIQKREESIKLLDELIKSTFLDMFINNPENNTWELNKIEDLALKQKGSMRTGPFGSDLLHSEFVEDGEVAVLGIDNAVNNKFMWGQRRYITNEKYEQLKRYTIYPNDIIITIMGTVGRTAVIPEDIPLAINTKHLAALTLNQELVNSFFIAYSLRENPYILNQIKKKTRGALMDGLNLTIIKNLSLVLPPKPLQDKFAEIVTQIENTKTIYQNSLTELNNLFGSIAQKAFKGELDLTTLNVNNEIIKIDEIPEDIKKKEIVELKQDIEIIDTKDDLEVKEKKIIVQTNKNKKEEKNLFVENVINEAITKWQKLPNSWKVGTAVIALGVGVLGYKVYKGIQTKSKDILDDILDVEIQKNENSTTSIVAKKEDFEAYGSKINVEQFENLLKEMLKDEYTFEEIKTRMMLKGLVIPYDEDFNKDKKKPFTYSETIFKLLKSGEIVQKFDKDRKQIVLGSAK